MTGKPRVHELARELGMDSRALLRWLNDNGEFVKSASSTIELAVARKVREAHPVPTVPAPARAPVDRPRLGQFPTTYSASRSRRKPARRGPRLPWSPARDLAEEWAGIQHDDPAVVQHHHAAVEEWVGRFIGIEDIRTWRAAGLGPYDSHLVEPILAAGIRPADLGRRVEGRLVVERIKGGEPCAAVRARLDAAGTDERTA